MSWNQWGCVDEWWERLRRPGWSTYLAFAGDPNIPYKLVPILLITGSNHANNNIV